jgi:hypothetical protein
MSVPPSRCLATVLRGTLTLIDYYGEKRGYAAMLRPLKLELARAIGALERMEETSFEMPASERPGLAPREIKPADHVPFAKSA